MEQIKEVNLVDNKKLLMRLNILSIPILIVFLWVFSEIAKLKIVSRQEMSFFIVLLLFFILILVHELIHGFFFKVFNPKGNVKFGYKRGLFYATSPGSYYGKWQFNLIALAPFVLISVALMGSYFLNWLSVDGFVWLASLHGSACIGDFYYSYLLIKAPKDVKIEDTEKGINFYQLTNGKGVTG